MSCNAPICALCKVKSYSTSLENREAWFCTLCIKHIFPFNHIDNHDQYIQSIRGLSNEEYQLFILNFAPKVEFNLDSCDRIKLINNEEIDPDVNLFGEGLIDAHYTPPALLKKKLSINIDLSSIMHINWFHDNSSTDISSTTLRLQTLRLQTFRLLLYTSVQDSYTSSFCFIKSLFSLIPTSTYTMIPFYQSHFH